LVNVLKDTTLSNVRDVEVRMGVVSVSEENSDNIIWVAVDPFAHPGEPVGDGTGVEEITGRVAEVRNG
jgi:hypothetical protein